MQQSNFGTKQFQHILILIFITSLPTQPTLLFTIYLFLYFSPALPIIIIILFLYCILQGQRHSQTPRFSQSFFQTLPFILGFVGQGPQCYPTFFYTNLKYFNYHKYYSYCFGFVFHLKVYPLVYNWQFDFQTQFSTYFIS